jgi:hypothetical protein
MPMSINYATVHARCPQWISLDEARIEQCGWFQAHRDQTAGGLGSLSMTAEP